jgi:uncharacterized membrane protein
MHTQARHELRPYSHPSSAAMRDWAALGGGVLLVLFGASRRSIPGLCLTAAGTPLVYRGVAGRWPGTVAGDTRTDLAGARGVHVRESVRLEKPIDEVFSFWRRLENLPRFMDHLESVRETGDKQSHWTARGPADMRVEWDAEIINEVPNQVIGWRSLPGSQISTAGSVNFDAVRGGRSTQVTVNLQYSAPAGRAGDLLARVFGRAPSQTIREDLRRLKQVLEAGEIAQAAPAEEGSR